MWLRGRESGDSHSAPRLWQTLAVSVAAGVLALAGCGNGEGDGAETEENTSDDSAASERDERAAELGESSLTFTATTVDGEEFAADELTGRPAVFWFWAPWCSTCVAEAPHVLDLAEEHGDDVSVVGVASLGTNEEMHNFIELTETEELTHLDDQDGDVWRQFEITEQSTFALVDASGQTTYSGFLDPDELADRVAELAG
ncbi:TlpA family protein disulfide reductase [Phytoactinopolyspora endophytica]|uniref:TlpA family protein disulfide reductase n=1 Tax=Phytoactinopolyspora endophytica TaxID=1642495 RepID=UPI00101C2237|nr:redoxin domain-containing protein [Phytoactinopolyspora endophytica]